MKKIPFQKALLPALISSTLILAACGGGGSSSTQATGRTLTSGIITGFGSIYVNGIKFETDQASFDVDDNPDANQSDLRVGMRIKIDGQINDDGLTGRADSVIYENELEGPVSAIDNTDPANILLTILGQTVTVNADTTFDDDFNLDINSIQVGDLLEISGFSGGNGIIATHIEKQGDFNAADSEVEIKGEIHDLTDNSFTIQGFSVTYDSSTELEDITTLTAGLYVEVKGRLNDSADTLIAQKIEAEHDDLHDASGEVEIEGLVANYDETNQSFTLQGQAVDASQSPTLMPGSLQLVNDIKVEVEGYLVDSVLVAEKIKLRGRKIKIHASISAIDTDLGSVSFSVFGGTDNLQVRVNQQTEMEDDISDIEDLQLAQLAEGDYVEVEAFDDGTEVINAIKLQRKESDDVQLQGPITSYDASVMTVTMFGQSFDLSQASFEAENDESIDASGFFNQLTAGGFIELSDQQDGMNLPDGVIDKAEIEEEDDD